MKTELEMKLGLLEDRVDFARSDIQINRNIAQLFPNDEDCQVRVVDSEKYLEELYKEIADLTGV